MILTILFIWQLRLPGKNPPRQFPLAGWVRLLLVVFTVVFLLLGAGLLVVPLTVAPLWPWPLSALTGRAVGAWLIGIGIITGQAAWENDRQRVQAVMASLVAFSLLQLLALARYGNEIAWDNPSSWLYVVVLLSLGLIGAHGLLEARTIRGAA